MEDGKPWYTSKTIFVNLVAILASALAIAGFELTADQQSALVTLLLAAANIALRLVTTTAVTK